MPEAGEGFTASASCDGEFMTLAVVGDTAFSGPRFFSSDELVWHHGMQVHGW